MTFHWHDDEHGFCPCDEPAGVVTAPAGVPGVVVPEPLTAEQFADHLINCGPRKPDATIVCDKGVNGDDVIATMVATGYWRLSDEVEYVGGKRIRHLVPVSKPAEEA